ncbi:hypothetical protein DFR70_103558 [Nocardia tenerifensis]|uniref:Uncharacterized protein n=1 Tax=Nocardia tenerifensis TaxID=228006 RepID=A0A318K8I2_9NOCA|nr:DUF6069 family protein [Nocardia tenerifensis]PXX66808.1 hypothetical protein DFR70_103558 [Nocardia tenerifensis]
MTIASTTTPALRIPAVNRPTAVLGSVAVAVAANLVVWLLGEAAGGSFEVVDQGVTTSVGAGTVIVSSGVPLLIGMTLAALVSYFWFGALRVAQVVGAVLAVATIGLTVAAEFDTVTTVALSVMHLVLAPVLVVGLEAMRRGLSAR